MNGNDLIALGYEPGVAIGLALQAAKMAKKMERSREDILGELTKVLTEPNAYLEDMVYGPVAKRLVDEAKQRSFDQLYPLDKEGGIDQGTIEQSKSESEQKLALLKEDYLALEQEVIALHALWNQFVALYITSDESVSVLSSTAVYFFDRLQRSLLDDVLLSIARLTDPSETLRGKDKDENLTLLRLPALLKDIDPGLKDKTQSAIWHLAGRKKDKTTGQAEMPAQVQYARDHRNWRIAHMDYGVKRGKSATKQLPGFKQEDVETSLEAIRNVMNHIRCHILDGEMGFENVIVQGDANDLINFLKYAQECFDNERRSALGELD